MQLVRLQETGSSGSQQLANGILSSVVLQGVMGCSWWSQRPPAAFCSGSTRERRCWRRASPPASFGPALTMTAGARTGAAMPPGESCCPGLLRSPLHEAPVSCEQSSLQWMWGSWRRLQHAGAKSKLHARRSLKAVLHLQRPWIAAQQMRHTRPPLDSGTAALCDGYPVVPS